MKTIYPWLLSGFPILHLYSENLGAVRDEEVFPATLASLAITTVVFFAFRSLIKSRAKSALMTALVVSVFLSYGHCVMLIDPWNLTHPARIVLLAMAIGVGALIVTVWQLPADMNLRAVTTAFNVGAFTLLILPSLTIIGHWLQVDELVRMEKRPRRYRQVADTPEYPDIYYIIADGYPSNGQLLRDYGYNNTAFTDALETLGFFVAYDSKSNYGATLNSLSSSLNMRYVTENTAADKVDDLVYLRSLIADSEVARVLMERGYTYVYMLSGFLLPSRIADLNLDFFEDAVKKYHSQSRNPAADSRVYKEPFYPLLLNTTLLRLVSGDLQPLLLDAGGGGGGGAPLRLE